MFRIAIMGSKGVGKTSFISRLLDNCLADQEPFTKRIHFSPDNRRKSYVIQAVINSQLLETSFTSYDAYIVMFDVSEPKTEEYALELIGYINNIYLAHNTSKSELRLNSAQSPGNTRFASVTSILSGQKKIQPITALVGNFADKLNLYKYTVLSTTFQQPSVRDINCILIVFQELVKRLRLQQEKDFTKRTDRGHRRSCSLTVSV